MIRFVTMTAVLVFSTGGFAYAGDPGDPDMPCDGSTYEMVECLNAKTAQWDKRMTIAYQLMLKAGEPKRREQLRVA